MTDRESERYIGPGSGKAEYYPVRAPDGRIVGWQLIAVGALMRGAGATQANARAAFDDSLNKTERLRCRR